MWYLNLFYMETLVKYDEDNLPQNFGKIRLLIILIFDFEGEEQINEL